MKVRIIASLVLALCLGIGTANASSIGIYFAADGSDCDYTAAMYGMFNWYVLVHAYGDGAVNGVTSAEFRVDGVPASWFNNISANPAANTVLGNLFTGTNVAFPGCMPGPWILLYTVSSLPTAPPTAATWRIMQHTTPSNPNLPCPLVTLCDAPYYTAICVSGGQAYLNGQTCSVGVEQSTWSQVKSMYN
jgi:hypothetical protein